MTEIRLCSRCDYPLGGPLMVYANRSGTCPSCHADIWPLVDATHTAPRAPSAPPEAVTREMEALANIARTTGAQEPILGVTVRSPGQPHVHSVRESGPVLVDIVFEDRTLITLSISAALREIKWVVQHVPTNEQLGSGRLALGPARSPAPDQQ